MKNVSLFGIIFIIAGALLLAYQGFITYPTTKKLAEVGDVKLTTQTEETIHVPPVVGGLLVLGGIAMVVVGRRNR